MLKQRVITAIILTAVFLSALFGLSLAHFALFIGAVVLIGAWEWANLSSCGALAQRIGYVIFIALVLAGTASVASLFSAGQVFNPVVVKSVLVAAVIWWVIALFLVKAYPSSTALWGHPVSRLVIGVFVLVPTWLALVYVRFQPQGAWLVVMIAAIVAAADTGGYFSGRKFGKHKLAPSVSPGKTLEGFAGGLLSNIVLVAVVAYLSGSAFLTLLAIVLPTSLFSVLGDLLESMVKRHAGVKDSGVILPGHGGILDRVDSITAAAPVFALALLLSGWVLGQ